MTPLFDESTDAFQELPAPMQEVLKGYSESRTDEDLNAVILAVLTDLGAEVGPAEISDETNFISDLGLDSLAIAEFVFFFEDVFEIKITNDVLADMRTLGSLKTFLKSEMK